MDKIHTRLFGRWNGRFIENCCENEDIDDIDQSRRRPLDRWDGEPLWNGVPFYGAPRSITLSKEEKYHIATNGKIKLPPQKEREPEWRELSPVNTRDVERIQFLQREQRKAEKKQRTIEKEQRCQERARLLREATFGCSTWDQCLCLLDRAIDYHTRKGNCPSRIFLGKYAGKLLVDQLAERNPECSEQQLLDFISKMTTTQGDIPITLTHYNHPRDFLFMIRLGDGTFSFKQP